MKPKRKMETLKDSDLESEAENENDDDSEGSGDGEDGSDDDDVDSNDNDDGDMFPEEVQSNGIGASDQANGVTSGHEINGDDDGEDDIKNDGEEPSSKRRRIVAKPLTSEEASALTSAETSLTANLFKFQTSEMLKEIRIDDDFVAKRLQPVVDRVKSILLSSSSAATAAAAAAATPAKMLQHIEEIDGVKIPFRRFLFSSFKSESFGGTFQVLVQGD